MDTLANLNPQQQAAVEHINGPMLILAGAGSGKTKVLTCRIAHLLELGVSPYKILAITFTNKAAKEMRDRVDTMVGPAAKDVWLYTFHAFCARFLRREIEVLGTHKSNFAIYDAADQKNLLKSILKDMNLDEKRFPPAALQNAISNAKNQMQDAAAFAKLAGDFFEQKAAEVYELYEKRLLANNAMDFDDLLMLTVKILAEFPEVREKYQQRFSYIMIDEYQDTNRTQYLLTRLLAGDEGNLCVVGDADQSIYGWRGADIRNILDFEKDYPKAKLLKLEQNYRSTTEAGTELPFHYRNTRRGQCGYRKQHGPQAEKIVDEKPGGRGNHLLQRHGRAGRGKVCGGAGPGADPWRPFLLRRYGRVVPYQHPVPCV